MNKYKIIYYLLNCWCLFYFLTIHKYHNLQKAISINLDRNWTIMKKYWTLFTKAENYGHRNHHTAICAHSTLIVNATNINLTLKLNSLCLRLGFRFLCDRCFKHFWFACRLILHNAHECNTSKHFRYNLSNLI